MQRVYKRVIQQVEIHCNQFSWNLLGQPTSGDGRESPDFRKIVREDYALTYSS